MKSRLAKVVLSIFIFCSSFIITLVFHLLSESDEPFKNFNLPKHIQEEMAAVKKYIGHIDEFNAFFAKRMEGELKVHKIGTLDRLSLKVEQMGLKFEADRPASIPEARALLLLLIDKYTQAINADKKIRPYLKEHPFKQVRIFVSFQTKNNVCSEGNVACVSNLTDPDIEHWKNQVYYCSQDSFTLKEIYLPFEEMDEAIRLNEGTPIQHLTIHQATAREEAFALSYDHQFVLEMKQTVDMECSCIGEKNADGIVEIGSYFVVHSPVTLDEARELIVIANSRLLKAINQNEKLRPYLKECPFGAHQVKMHLSFQDKNGFPYTGNVSYVTLEKNVISYHHYNWDTWGDSPCEEAVRIVDIDPLSNRKFKR